MDTQTQRRIASNEALFRGYNEQVQAAIQEFNRDTGEPLGQVLNMACECAMPDCTDMIALSTREYEHVRSDGLWFMTRPGHVVPGVEFPIEEHEQYWIIQKVRLGAQIAEETDPRS